MCSCKIFFVAWSSSNWRQTKCFQNVFMFDVWIRNVILYRLTIRYPIGMWFYFDIYSKLKFCEWFWWFMQTVTVFDMPMVLYVPFVLNLIRFDITLTGNSFSLWRIKLNQFSYQLPTGLTNVNFIDKFYWCKTLMQMTSIPCNGKITWISASRDFHW